MSHSPEPTSPPLPDPHQPRPSFSSSTSYSRQSQNSPRTTRDEGPRHPAQSQQPQSAASSLSGAGSSPPEPSARGYPASGNANGGDWQPQPQPPTSSYSSGPHQPDSISPTYPGPSAAWPQSATPNGLTPSAGGSNLSSSYFRSRDPSISGPTPAPHEQPNGRRASHELDEGGQQGPLNGAPLASPKAPGGASASQYAGQQTQSPYSDYNSSSQQGPSPDLGVGSSGGHGGSSSGHQMDADEGLGLGSIAETDSMGGPPTGYAGSIAGGGGQRRASGTSGMHAMHGEEDLVPVGFDEGVLRGLCDLDCGMPLLLDRMKQSMASCREASAFLKKRAIIEEEYARSMIKLARSSSESYSISEGKSGSFVQSWVSLLRTHEVLGDNRLKFAAQLNEMGDELIGINKEVEKNRKATKDLGTRLERGLAEQEALVDKARVRFDSSAEELERLLLVKQGESLKDPIAPYTSSGPNAANKRTFGKAISKLKGPKSVAQVARQEEEVRSRMGQSSDSYRAQVSGAQTVRQEYFSLQLPRILRSLKESVDELDLGTQYHLSRYAFLFESTIVTDGLTISPVSSEDGPGIKAVIDSIDLREDFKTFMNQFALSWQMSGQRGPKRDGEGLAARPVISPRPSITNFSAGQSFSTAQAFPPPTRPTFGVDLGEQMARDGVEVPRILEKCCEAIELHGLDSMGIYRLSGTTSRVQRLKGKLDRDIEGTDLLSEENLTDINDIAAVMKLWFREMPEPLLTWELYHGFIEAAKIENDRLRHIRLHERVNELPDPNYATLKFLMGHLDKIKSREHANQMSGSNLAIVFGPNLLGAPPSNNGSGQGTALADMSWQCKCVETILQHYVEIFVDTEG